MTHSPDDRLDCALTDHRAGRTQSAVAIYRVLLDELPESADLHHLLALALAPSDQAGSAASFRRALALGPGVGLYLHNAASLSPPSDGDEREPRLTRALAVEPANAVLQQQLGARYVEIGRLPLAARAYRRALATDPTPPTLHFDLASLDLHLKNTEPARTRYARVLALAGALPDDKSSGFHFWTKIEIGGRRWQKAAMRFSSAAAAGTIDIYEAATLLLHLCATLGDDAALLGMTEAALVAAESAGLDPVPILRKTFAVLYRDFPIQACWRVLPRLRELTPPSIDAQDLLGFVLYQTGDAEGARQAFVTAATAIEARASRHPLAAGVRVLYPNWPINSLGEMAIRFSTIVKLRRLGLLRARQVVLPAPRGEIVNETFLDLFGQDLTIVKEGPDLDRYLAVAEDLALDTGTPPWADGRLLPLHEAWQAAEIAWQQSGGGPLLTPTPATVARGREKLAELGIGPDDWFVGLHVRDDGFHNDLTGRSRHDERFRNANLDAYRPAIERIVGRNGRVIRFGDSRARPMPEMPGVVDYAHLPWRSPEIDVALWSLCRFFIGTQSGVAHALVCLGVPIVYTNINSCFVIASTRDIWMPKLYRERRTGRILPLRECLAAPFRANLRGSAFDDLGIDLIDNTGEDIADAVDEMLDRLEGRRSAVSNPIIESLYELTGNLYPAPLSETFFARHQTDLLGF